MTYNAMGFSGDLAAPAAGFASRKGTQLKPISVPTNGSITQDDPPRTSRSHLLAGLRTAPKVPATPLSAPYQRVNTQYNTYPHTAIGTTFPASQYNPNAQVYLPEVLAPPSVNFTQEEEQMDPNVVAQLMATEMYLAQRQQQLQQQLVNLQMQGMSVNERPQAYQNEPVQLVYNPATNQYSYVVNQQSPQPMSAVSYQSELAPVSEFQPSSFAQASPPKKTPTPPHVTPLPPPSANAFRRGHKKVPSLAFDVDNKVADGPKSAFVRPVGFPPTPTTGTFGPGQGRAGEHPIRQPRGPPPLEELMASPTAKHEGSRNFATRQRRRAVHSLVRAGIERRSGRAEGSMTPSSEDLAFPFSDNDSDSGSGSGSGSGGTLSGRPSLGSLRAAASGVIGSEMKTLRESREGSLAGSPSEEVRGGVGESRRTPMLVFTSAEKRKSYGF